LLSLALGAAGAAPAAELTVQGTRFAIDGEPQFLIGVSAYGALGAPEGALRADLEALRKQGVRGVRVWATWTIAGDDVAAVGPRGGAVPDAPREARRRERPAGGGRRRDARARGR